MLQGGLQGARKRALGGCLTSPWSNCSAEHRESLCSLPAAHFQSQHHSMHHEPALARTTAAHKPDQLLALLRAPSAALRALS